jgi:hypothetical protein
MLLGAEAGLAMPAATESVMGSLPKDDTGVPRAQRAVSARRPVRAG